MLKVSLEVETPQRHKRYVVARLMFGGLKYYDSYSSLKRAIEVMMNKQDAIVIDTEEV